jgi:hypothetical protein
MEIFSGFHDALSSFEFLSILLFNLPPRKILRVWTDRAPAAALVETLIDRDTHKAAVSACSIWIACDEGVSTAKPTNEREKPQMHDEENDKM